MDYAWFLFSFEGRINRAKYWLATLIILCWMIFVLLILAALATVFGIGGHPLAIDVVGISASIQLTDDDPSPKAALFAQLVLIPITFIFAWCYAATSIKRLHDRNRSGWWLVPFFLIPGLYGQFSDRLGDSIPMALCGAVIGIIYFWGYVEMCFLRGTRGTNLFGSDPLAPIDTRPRWDQHSELEFVPHRASPSTGTHDKRRA